MLATPVETGVDEDKDAAAEATEDVCEATIWEDTDSAAVTGQTVYQKY